MKENIETKDVQRTEYLDKNGLDMLWTKVKENTHNQVEVEYNRAKEKEDSLSQEIASVKPAKGKVFLQVEDEVTEDTKILKDDSLSFGDYRNQQAFSVVTSAGFSVKKDAQEVAVLSTGIKADVERGSDTKVWNTNGGITDLTSYALNSDVTEKIAAKADTTALAALEEKVTANTTAISGKQDAGTYLPAELYDGRNDVYTIPTYTNIIENEHLMTTLRGGGISLNDSTSRQSMRIGTYQILTSQNRLHVNGEECAYLKDIPTAATKEQLGIVKVGDGLNVADGTVSVDPDYITEHFLDMVSYGVEWDTTVADPACTRIGNPLLHKQLPIQSEYKGCLVKDGKVNYYLDPNDWSKKADGTPSVLDGTDGDVMVHTPAFYGKSGSNGNKRWVRISTTKIDSTWTYIPSLCISAYRITTYTDTSSNKTKAASVVNTTAKYRGGENRGDYDQYLSSDQFRTDLGKPRTDVSRATMRDYASNSGQGLLCYEFYKWVFYWAYVIEYANFNSQKEFNSELTSDGYHQGGLGMGVTVFNQSQWSFYNDMSPLTPCGYTNEFGNFSGVKQMVIPAVENDDGITVGSDTTMYANRWRGFENPFGDVYTILDGIILKRDSADTESKVYTTSSLYGITEDISLMNFVGVESATDSYIKEFDLGETGEIIPQSSYGSESTYKCDLCYSNRSLTSKRLLSIGGCAHLWSRCGLVHFDSGDSVDYHDSLHGFRSAIIA